MVGAAVEIERVDRGVFLADTGPRGLPVEFVRQTRCAIRQRDNPLDCCMWAGWPDHGPNC